MPHGLTLDPRTHVIACACGRSFEGYGALDRATAHLGEVSTRRGKQLERLASLDGAGLTTAEAAQRWHVCQSDAYTYLRRLVRLGAVVVVISGVFPRRARWARREP